MDFSYPFGPFPNEIFYLMVGPILDPPLYRNLSLVSSRVRNLLFVFINQIGETRISNRELIRFVSDLLQESKTDYQLSIWNPIRPNLSRRFLISLRGVYGSTGGRYLDPYKDLIDTYGDDRLLDLKTTYNILRRRTSCLCFDPQYPLKYVYKIFKYWFNRYLKEYCLDDPFVITKLYELSAEMWNLLDLPMEVLDQFHRFRADYWPQDLNEINFKIYSKIGQEINKNFKI